jgi:predicted Zn-dependent peptidase
MTNRIYLTLLFLTGFFALSFAQVDRTKAPKPGPAPKVVVGDYGMFELPNGLKVIVVENHRLPKVDFTMVYNYDPFVEGENQGFVDIAGSLIGTGTATRSKDQINDEIDFIGASLSFNANGLNASCLSKNNEKLLEIMSDALINAVFTQEELEKIKKQTLSGLAASKKEPDAISDRVARALMYSKQHPYGGSISEKSIESINIDLCRDFYKNYVRPNISYMAIVGDITLAQAEVLVTKHFSSWQKSDIAKYNFPLPVASPATRVAIYDRPASVQSLIKVCYPVPLKLGDEDFIKAKVANTILGGGTFRLFNNLREKHGYTYGAYSQLNQDRVIGSFTASAEVRNSATDSATKEILYEMQRMRNEKVPAEELNMVKNYAAGTFALSLENPQTIANFALNIERYNLPKDFYQNYISRILAITAEDIQQVSRKYFLPENAIIVVVGKGSEIAKPMASFSQNNKVEYYDFDANPVVSEKKLKPAPAGVTAEAVIEKYLEAIGGRKKLEKINDITVTMSTSMQGMAITIKQVQKAPNKMLVDVGSGGMSFSKQIYDGTKGIMTSPIGNQEVTGKELTDMKYQAMINIELRYEKEGISTKLAGIDDVNGNQAYVIELVYPDGSKETEYYEVTTGFKIRKVAEEGKTDFFDYRDVNGFKYPYLIQQDLGGENMKLKIESIEINGKVDDSLFKI